MNNITLSDDYIYANAEEEEEAKIGMAFAKQQAEHEAVIVNRSFDYFQYHNHQNLSDEMPF